MSASLRAVAVGALSLLIVVASIAYVLVPAGIDADLEVREVSGSVSYDQTIEPEYLLVSAAEPGRRYRQVLYGAIESPQGVPVRRAVVQLSGTSRKTRTQRAVIRVGGTGTYRSVLRLVPGPYRITVTLQADGRPVTSTGRIRLRDGKAYRASVRVRESGVISMLPISSY